MVSVRKNGFAGNEYNDGGIIFKIAVNGLVEDNSSQGARKIPIDQQIRKNTTCDDGLIFLSQKLPLILKEPVALP